MKHVLFKRELVIYAQNKSNKQQHSTCLSVSGLLCHILQTHRDQQRNIYKKICV